MTSFAEQAKPTVSVIVPTYNRAHYLSEALKSIAAQTRPPLEVIIVDDGSTDDTEALVRQSPLPIQYLRQNHQGVAEARNRGLEASQGDLIAWLDSDDLWEPRFLETLVSRLAADATLDGIYCGSAFIDQAGERLPATATQIFSPEALHNVLVEDNFILTPTIIVRRECFARIGPFDTRLRVSEDYDMWLRLAECYRIEGIQDVLVRCRVHSTNTMANVDLLRESRLALVAKRFGPPDGSPDNWPAEKRRAYGFAYRSLAVGYTEQGHALEARNPLTQAALLWPPILARLDTFYELACGDQPRGYRGDASSLDLEANARAVLSHLDSIFGQHADQLGASRAPAYGNAYLALAMLSEQAGQWSQAKGYLVRAIRANRRLLGSTSVVRRLAKLTIGPRATDHARRLLRKLDMHR